MRSDIVKRGFERAPHRSLLKATGRKVGEKLKGYFDALEESRKP